MGRKLGMKAILKLLLFNQNLTYRHTLNEYINVIALMFSVLKRTG